MDWKFQFLLVRLKDDCKGYRVDTERISIPSGTIKRRDVFPNADAILKFQFLLVRLKVYNSKRIE
jgi:hypothetical protein